MPGMNSMTPGASPSSLHWSTSFGALAVALRMGLRGDEGRGTSANHTECFRS